jgi:transposase
LSDPSFDFTLLHDFRCRVLTHESGQRFLDTFLAACKARGWMKARGTQRTDSTHVLAAIRMLHRLECVLEAMHHALNQLSDVAPAWVQQHVSLDWHPRYGLRSDQMRLPKDASHREALARQIGADGYQRLARVWAADPSLGLRELPALEARRRIWLQQYYRCTVPGIDAWRWRPGDEQPPAAVRIASPKDLEARYSSKRETHWVGCKVHLPDLITQVLTTPATTQDSVMGPTIQQDLADRDLLPGTHLLDSGYVDADLLVTAQIQHQIDVVGPPFGSYCRRRRAGQGYDLQALSSTRRPSRRTVPRGMPASIGAWARCLEGSGHSHPLRRGHLSRMPHPPGLYLGARRPTPTHGPAASPTRRSRPRGTARRPRSSPHSMPCGQEWRAASRKVRDALICVGVDTSGWHGRTSSIS